MKDVVIAAVAMFGLVGFYYLRRGEVCLTPGLVVAVIFPFVILIFEWRLHAIVWDDVWKKFEKPSEPVDQVVERMLKEADIPFERQGPWQAFKSFKYQYQERFLLEDGSTKRDSSLRTGRGSVSVDQTSRWSM
jgi:hypothetical protein